MNVYAEESLSLCEPLVVSEATKAQFALVDLALELATRSSSFESRLPPETAISLAALVRSMNCYYSNLIEGHNTHPIEIERALKQDFSQNQEKRNLQLEAKAHIAVQEWIDQLELLDAPTSPNMILELHRRFCSLLPTELLELKNPDNDTITKVLPGVLRSCHVKVGQHIPIGPESVARFLERMHQAYSQLGKLDSILSAAYAHHRLLWIHPFVDGNGRVARLMSYAILKRALKSNGLWSIARGLARKMPQYKAHLAACDLRRRNDLDGRGNLSEEELAKFTKFFLETCLDQVDYMQKLMQPENLHNRIMLWAEHQMRIDKLPPKSDLVMKIILYSGQIERAALVSQLGVSERTTRRITSALLEVGALKSVSSKSPLQIAFPATLAEHWLPGLFPEI